MKFAANFDVTAFQKEDEMDVKTDEQKKLRKTAEEQFKKLIKLKESYTCQPKAICEKTCSKNDDCQIGPFLKDD